MKNKVGVFVIGMLIFLGINNITAVETEKTKKTTTEKKTTPTKPAPKKVLVDDFEDKEGASQRGMLTTATTVWRYMAREFKLQADGAKAIEDASADILNLVLITDKKLVKNGKQSLKIEYTPSAVSEDKFAYVALVLPSDRVVREEWITKHLMGDNNAVSIWFYIDKGKGELTVDLVDSKMSTVRFSTVKPVSLDFKGWKQFVFTKDDFGVNKDNEQYWSDIVRLSFKIKGNLVFSVDKIEFTSAQ